MGQGYLNPNSVYPVGVAPAPAPIPPTPVLPPGCNEDFVLCELLGQPGVNHYLAFNSDQPVYNIPSETLLPQAYEDARDGFLPCTFDEHLYDGVCGGCKKGDCGKGDCDKCKYYPGKFLIGIEQSRTKEERSFSNFVLSANGIRGRTIYLTRGERYNFFFQPCCLAVDPRLLIDGDPNPTAGEPLPKSAGGVVVKCDDIPVTFQDVTLIFTTNLTPKKPLTTGGPNYREAMGNTYPIPLFGAQWLYIGPHVPATFLIAGQLDPDLVVDSTSAPYLILLQKELAGAALQVVVREPTTTTFTSRS